MFFRKKSKYTDVEGYNRISRLIEDRQREISQNMTDDQDFDDDSILLSHDAPSPRERIAPVFSDDTEGVSAIRPASQVVPEPQPPAGSAALPPSVGNERRVPFQVNPTQPASSAPAVPREAPIPAPPPMPVPEFAASANSGSFIAAEAVWEGKLITNGQLRVEGTLHGEIQTPSNVFVAANAHLDGIIRAGSIVVAGEVEGKVECSERLEVLPGGSARGEIETATLVVHEGAFIDSRFQMRKSTP